ncbi:hypothetical protein [Saccharopolyspora sp. NPDC002578]
MLELQRTVGNAEVARLLANRADAESGPRPPGADVVARSADVCRCAPAVPVQRLAFVGEKQVEPDGEWLTGTMRGMASDSLVRDYTTNKEFADHAAGALDYLGNLPRGERVWVRFDPKLTNVLGEQHSQTTLADVLEAVGAKSYLYEAFVTEDLDSEPKTKSAYSAGLGKHAANFGLQDGGWASHGVESLYPKLGEAMTKLLGYMNGGNLELVRKEGDHRHIGVQLARFLKVAWGYGADALDQGGASSMQATRSRLAEAREEAGKRRGNVLGLRRGSPDLDSRIAALPTTEPIGDELVTWDQSQRDRLSVYLRAVVADLRERGKRDMIAPTDENNEDHEKEFIERRNKHMEHRVNMAIHRGIRYVGMGLDHYYDIKPRLPEAEFHGFELTGVGLFDFNELTRQRAHSARSAAG